MNEIPRIVDAGREVVLRSYIDRNTPENTYRSLRIYHLSAIGLFLFWLAVRCFSIAGTQFYSINDTVVSMLPIEVRFGTAGALVSVVYAAFNIATLYGLIVKERWGWWLALIGLCWGITQGLGDVLISIYLDQFGWACWFHLLCYLAVACFSAWMIAVMLSPGMRSKFEVQVNASIALACSIGLAVVLGGVVPALLL